MKNIIFSIIAGLLGALLLSSCGKNAGGNTIIQTVAVAKCPPGQPKCGVTRTATLSGQTTATIVDNRTTNFAVFAREPGAQRSAVRYGSDLPFRNSQIRGGVRSSGIQQVVYQGIQCRLLGPPVQNRCHIQHPQRGPIWVPQNECRPLGGQQQFRGQQQQRFPQQFQQQQGNLPPYARIRPTAQQPNRGRNGIFGDYIR